jgi:hypothetical protein
MAFDEQLANRIRQVMSGREEFEERRMFGGIAFMVRGYMCCGLAGADLMVRVGPEAYPAALAAAHARPMDFTGRPLTGYVYVAPAGVKTAKALGAWVDRGLVFVRSLPPKKPAKRRAKGFVPPRTRAVRRRRGLPPSAPRTRAV